MKSRNVALPSLRGLVLLFLLLFLLPAPATTAGQHLRVGFFISPPLAFLDEGGRAQGLFIDVFSHIAQLEGWDIEYVAGGLNESYDRLAQGKIDILLPAGYSGARAEKFDFPEQYLLLEWGIVIRSQGAKIDTIFDLQGVDIAVVQGSIFVEGLRDYLKQFHIEARLIEKKEPSQVVAAVASGECMAGVSNNIGAAQIQDKFPVERTSILLTPVHLTYAATKHRHTGAITAINHHLTRLRNDPQSLFWQRLEYWLPQPHKSHDKYILWGGALLAGVILLGGLSLYLRRQVRVKVAELVNVNRELLASREELHRLNQQFQTLLDGIPDHLMLVSPQRQVLWMNRAARLFSGADRNTSPTMFCFQEWTQLHDYCDGCPVQACFVTGEAQETVMRSNDKTFGVKAFPITNDSGEVESVIKLAIDITEKAKLRADVDRKNRLSAVGELSAGVAHEINNPVGLILSNLTTICEAFDDIAPLLDDHYHSQGDFPFGGLYFSRMREQLPALLKETGEAARRIRQIVEDLKAFARGADSQDVADFRLADAVAYSLRLSGILLRKSTNSFTLDQAPEDIVIDGCERRVEQVLVNLLANACQSLPDRNCAVTLETRYDHDRQEAVIVICDKGVGIPAEHLPKLATPFFTTRHSQGGTGLGLSVSFGIVKEHNGTIHFASSPGKGTTVTVSFPARIAEPAA